MVKKKEHAPFFWSSDSKTELLAQWIFLDVFHTVTVASNALLVGPAGPGAFVVALAPADQDVGDGSWLNRTLHSTAL